MTLVTARDGVDFLYEHFFLCGSIRALLPFSADISVFPPHFPTSSTFPPSHRATVALH